GCGSSITLSAALVQDAYKGDDLKLAMTLLQSLVIAGPVLAPFLGSFAVSHVGWRGIFWGLTVGGVVTVVLAGLIDETYDAAANAGKKLGATLVSMLKGAKTLLANRSFTALALFIGVTGIPFFAFIAVSPYILLDDFGLSYLGYSFIYAGACLTNMVAPFLYMRLSRTWYTAQIMKLVIAFVLASAVLLAAVGSLHPALLLAAFVPYALAEDMARPAAFLVLLDQPSNVVGTASTIGNFSYGVITALATVAAAFPWPTFTFGLVVLTACSGAVAAALYAIGHRGW
ncbi:MAG: MFS transporter, partial [Eggerthellaceae bacterium]|nr:MFS transporter [Eggerthellaceae bacterium]